VAHVFFAKRAGDGGEGFHGNKDVSSGGPPGRAVLREATARDEGVDVGVVLELSAPGMQDTGKTREICPDETRVFGAPFEGLRRGGAQGLVSDALMRADNRAQGLRDGAGEEEVRPGPLCLQVVG
jgi:hypothetical protein